MNEQIKAGLNWVLDRLGENSTWRGLIACATAFGAVVSPDQATKIIAAGLAVIGLINMFRTAPPSKAQVQDALDSKVDKTV